MRTMYLMRTLRGKTKTSPASAPFFISDPSKYIVQYSSVYSVMKSASTWDLMAIQGAYEMP